MKQMINYIYKISPRFIKNIIEKLVKKVEHGEYWSKTLRYIYLNTYGIEIGNGTYGCFKKNKYKYVRFKNYSSIAEGFQFLSRNHPKNYISTYPFFFNKDMKFIEKDEIEFSKLVIGNDVWIGMNVIVTSKCNFIGNGAIIGAGSIVTKDVAPYTIVAGNPAKIIGKRFDDETIKIIEESKWYDLSEKELLLFISLKDKPKKFAQAVIKYRKGLNHEIHK